MTVPPSRPAHRPLRSIFAWPAAIFLLTLLGLGLALTGHGLGDVIAWLSLAAPVAAVAWAVRARRS
jgi:hypothetical protein